MKIYRSSSSSNEMFRDFWNAALTYQESRQLPLWPAYPEQKIKDEIHAGLHFTLVMADHVPAGYFSIALTDKLIWGENERGDAIYIHRICVNPDRKGNNMTTHILSWAYGYALAAKRKFIRMDTWGDNQRLVNYYIGCGFQHVGNRRLGSVPDLPPHYSNANLALFENMVDLTPHPEKVC